MTYADGNELSRSLIFATWNNNLMTYMEENDIIGKFQNHHPGADIKIEKQIIIIMLSTICIYIFFHRYILAGIGAGAVKESEKMQMFIVRKSASGTAFVQ